MEEVNLAEIYPATRFIQLIEKKPKRFTPFIEGKLIDLSGSSKESILTPATADGPDVDAELGGGGGGGAGFMAGGTGV